MAPPSSDSMLPDRPCLWLAGVALLCAILAPIPGRAGEQDHSGHHVDRSPYERSQASYQVPDVSLKGRDGAPVLLAQALDSERPVLLNFIYTSCTTICPIQTATFAQLRRDLGASAAELRMVSISVDPEHDTPARLQEYAARFGADAEWAFLTGELDDIVRVQRAFDAYRDSKLDHAPITLLRAAGGSSWLRLEGFPAAEDLLREVRQLADR
jgi:protein SCO1